MACKFELPLKPGTERPTNCCFGDPGFSTICVTSRNDHFLREQTDRMGWAMFP